MRSRRIGVCRVVLTFASVVIVSIGSVESSQNNSKQCTLELLERALLDRCKRMKRDIDDFDTFGDFSFLEDADYDTSLMEDAFTELDRFKNIPVTWLPLGWKMARKVFYTPRQIYNSGKGYFGLGMNVLKDIIDTSKDAMGPPPDGKSPPVTVISVTMPLMSVPTSESSPGTSQISYGSDLYPQFSLPDATSYFPNPDPYSSASKTPLTTPTQSASSSTSESPAPLAFDLLTSPPVPKSSVSSPVAISTPVSPSSDPSTVTSQFVLSTYPASPSSSLLSVAPSLISSMISGSNVPEYNSSPPDSQNPTSPNSLEPPLASSDVFSPVSTPGVTPADVPSYPMPPSPIKRLPVSLNTGPQIPTSSIYDPLPTASPAPDVSSSTMSEPDSLRYVTPSSAFPLHFVLPYHTSELLARARETPASPPPAQFPTTSSVFEIPSPILSDASRLNPTVPSSAVPLDPTPLFPSTSSSMQLNAAPKTPVTPSLISSDRSTPNIAAPSSTIPDRVSSSPASFSSKLLNAVSQIPATSTYTPLPRTSVTNDNSSPISLNAEPSIPITSRTTQLKAHAPFPISSEIEGHVPTVPLDSASSHENTPSSFSSSSDSPIHLTPTHDPVPTPISPELDPVGPALPSSEDSLDPAPIENLSPTRTTLPVVTTNPDVSSSISSHPSQKDPIASSSIPPESIESTSSPDPVSLPSPSPSASDTPSAVPSQSEFPAGTQLDLPQTSAEVSNDALHDGINTFSDNETPEDEDVLPLTLEELLFHKKEHLRSKNRPLRSEVLPNHVAWYLTRCCLIGDEACENPVLLAYLFENCT